MSHGTWRKLLTSYSNIQVTATGSAKLELIICCGCWVNKLINHLPCLFLSSPCLPFFHSLLTYPTAASVPALLALYGNPYFSLAYFPSPLGCHLWWQVSLLQSLSYHWESVFGNGVEMMMIIIIMIMWKLGFVRWPLVFLTSKGKNMMPTDLIWFSEKWNLHLNREIRFWTKCLHKRMMSKRKGSKQKMT